jgi:hypothetical protein
MNCFSKYSQHIWRQTYEKLSTYFIFPLVFANSLSAQTAFPFFDDMENQTQSEAYWTSGDNWSNTNNIYAYSGNRIWHYTGANTTSYLTLSESMDLSGDDALNPKISFWVRSSGGYTYLYFEVSTDGGATWISLMSSQTYNTTTWTNLQFMLNTYRSDDVKVRIGANNSTGNMWLDDVRIDNAPYPQQLTLSDATNNGMAVSWNEDESTDFDYYCVVLSTNQSDLNTFPGEINSNTLAQRNEKIVFTENDQQEISKIFSRDEGNALRFMNTNYYARIWCVDSDGLFNQGSEIRSLKTSFNMDLEVAPKTQTFDDDPEPQWAGDMGWTITDAQDGVAGHSSPNCYESNPGSNYEKDSDRYLVSKWSIPYAMTRPVLSFNHRYSFASGDIGVLQYSLDGSNWTNIEQYSGSAISGWTGQEFDVSYFRNNSPGQPVYIRYSMDIDGDNNQSTGWMIDDVAINQNTRNEVAFPFYDNFEDTEQSEDNWVLSNWTNFETANPHGGLRVLRSNPTVGYHSGVDSWFYLGSPIDLSGAANAYLSIWTRSEWNSSNDPYLNIQVSYDGGLTWSGRLSERLSDENWVRHQISLSSRPDVRIRIGAARDYSNYYGWSPLVWVDDVYIGEQPYLLYPQSQSTDKPLCLTFLWRGTGSSAQFQLQVDDNDNFSSPVIDENDLTGGTYYSCGDLEESTRYYWRVRGLNPETNWTSSYYFNTGTEQYETLTSPTPESPANGETGYPHHQLSNGLQLMMPIIITLNFL